MKKKVCIVISIHEPDDVRVFHREARTLYDAGYEVTLIAQTNKSKYINGIKIIGAGKSKSRMERFFKIWKLFEKALSEKADIYHIHNPELLLLGVTLKIFTRKVVIYDVHEDFPDATRMRHWIPIFIREPIAQFLNIYEPLFSRFLNAVIAADNDIRKRFQFKNTITIFNFPRLEYFQQGIDSLNKQEERIANLIIHPGTLNRERGGDVIIEAIAMVKKKLPKVKLLLIGSTHSPEYEKHLRKKIETLNLRNNISFIPAIPQKEVITYIKKASLGLSLLQPIPKFKKNIPQKIFEYMASGIPFVVSDLPPTRPFIEEYKCGIMVDPTNLSQISETIIYLLSNPEESRKIGENGKRAVLEKYNWENEAKKLLNLYEKLCK